MARDSSPFARRFKALTRRPARAGGDDDAPTGEPAAPAEGAGAARGPVRPPEPGSTDQPASHAPVPAPDLPQETAAMPEDEQPTGEFPAIDPSGPTLPPPVIPPAASPVTDAPLDQRASTEGPGAWPPPAHEPESVPPAYDADPPLQDTAPSGPFDADPSDQPTTQMPALSPIWLDPPAYEQAPPPEPGAVDWSSPAEDVIEPTGVSSPAYEPPAEPTSSSDPVAHEPSSFEPIGTDAASFEPSAAAHTPIWEQEFEPADTGAAEPESYDPEPPSRLSEAAPAPVESADRPVQPAWMDDAEEPSHGSSLGAVVPPPRGDVDQTPGATRAQDSGEGPTLTPPVLSAPSTPSALNDALRLDDEPDDADTALHSDPASPDADGSATEAVSTSGAAGTTGSTDDEAGATGDADPITPEAESGTQSTQIQDAVPAAPRRGWRSAFGKRRSRADTAATPEPGGIEDDPSVADATAGGSDSDWDVADGDGGEPVAAEALTTAAHTDDDATAIRERSDASTTPGAPDAPAGDKAFTTNIAALTGGGTEPAGDATAEPRDPQDEPAPETRDAAEASHDDTTPGRFAALGRLGKLRKGKTLESDAPAPEGADTSDVTQEDDAEARRRAQAQEAEGAPVAIVEPVAVEVPEPPPLKPSFTERAALRRRAKSLRARRDAGLAELGAIVLDQSRFGDPTAGTLARRRTAELADLDNEIAAIEAALDEGGTAQAVAQLGVVHCSSCSALLGPADRFCVHCGTARPPADGISDGDVPSAA